MFKFLTILFAAMAACMLAEARPGSIDTPEIEVPKVSVDTSVIDGAAGGALSTAKGATGTVDGIVKVKGKKDRALLNLRSLL